MLSLDMDPSLAFDQHGSVAIDLRPNTVPPPSLTQFNAGWSPSKTAALTPSNLPMSKQPRAWERKACPPAGEQSRVKTVWKRYELRPQAQRQQSLTQGTNMEGGSGALAHPEKVVKRARVEEPSGATKVTYKATRWERRRSRGVTRKIPKQKPELVADANEGEKAPVDAPNTETSRAEHRDQDNMDETVSGEVSERQSDPTTSRLQEHPRDRDHVEETASLSNSHDMPVMDVLDTKDSERPDESPITEQGLEEASDEVIVDAQGESNRTECEEAITVTSVDTFSIKVSTDSVQKAQESSSAPPPADLTPSEVVGHTDMADTEASSAAVLQTSSTKTHHVRVEIPISHLTDILQGEEAKPMESSPLKQSDAASTSVYDESNAVEVTADLSSIAEELLKPPVSPISPADSPTKGAVPDGEVLKSDSQNVLQAPSHSQASEGNPGAQTATHTKQDMDESPEPEADPTDMTADFTTELTSQFDDDKDRLKAFIQRTKQEKANKAVSITRRESFQNRRDSDAVRRALASPRPALEEKDANVSSPTRSPSLQPIPLSKVLESAISDVEERDAPQPPAEDDAVTSPSLRRSTRKQSRIPQLPTAAAAAQQRTPKKISVRRTDGNETLILAQKKEAQELANLTRANTRKNKAAAVPATMRLAQMAAESLAGAFNGVNATGVSGASPLPAGERSGQQEEKARRKGVRWDEERLTSFRAAPVFVEDANTAASSLGPGQAKKSTSRVRRLKRLGAANGTPAKGLLASALLPDEVAEQNDAVEGAAKEKEKKDSKEKVGGNKANEKKSRLAPPKKLELKPSVTSVTGGVVPEGKENTAAAGRLVSPKKAVAGRGMIPVPAATTSVGGFGAVDGSIGAQPARKRVRKM